MVDSKTKKIYAATITDEKTGDAPQFKKLVDEAMQNIKDSPNVTASDELCVGADGAYDSNEHFKHCKENDLIPVIPIRKNFSYKKDGDTTRNEQELIQLGNCKINRKNKQVFDKLTEEQKLEKQKQWEKNYKNEMALNKQVFDKLTEEQKLENQKEWKENVKYQRRWAVEIAFSTYKRIFGENISSSSRWDQVVQEIKFKIMIYNKMIDRAMEVVVGV